MLGRFLRRVYDGFDTSNEIDTDMWREVLRIINEGTVEGLSQAKIPPTHDRMFYRELRHSNEVFSAFKVHTMGVEMAAKLVDGDGNLKPFSKWAKDVASITSHQVGSWLRTEYDTAVIRAHAAADWREFERNKDVMPNLRWMPTTSPEPDSAHRRYWEAKLTLPVDDPFWNAHHPGDRWNCKCSLEATDEPVNRPADLEPAPPQRGLENNPGKDGEIFNDTHPYFPDSCSSCPFYKGMSNMFGSIFSNAKKHCHACSKIDAKLKKAKESERKSEYNELRKDEQYHHVEYDKKTGGIKATHIGHINHSGSKDERFFGRLTSSDLECECQNALFKMGHTAILCDESKMAGGNRLPSLDLRLDGQMMDIRSITGHGWYSSSMISKNKQLKKYNARLDVTEHADTMCFYFHDPKLFDEKKMKKSINYFRYFRTNDGHLLDKDLKHVVCIIKGRDELIEYDI